MTRNRREGEMQARLRTAAPTMMLALGAAALIVPTGLRVAAHSWATEQGQFGVLALGLSAYFLRRAWPEIQRATPPAPIALVAPLLLGASAVYLLGRLADEYLPEAYGLLMAGVGALLAVKGWAAVRAAWLAALFGFLALPLPFALVSYVSERLRDFITGAVVATGRIIQLPIARDGLAVFVGDHRLDVEQACSGLNSLVSLSAVGLAYVELRRRPPAGYVLALAPIVFGAAVFANYARVLLLVLLTQAFGQSVAQGVLHEASGLLMFAAAFATVLSVDEVAGPRIRPRAS